MNWAIYQSFARIPLGIAVTIEFLGPLAVAVIGSRRLTDLIWVLLAGAGSRSLGVSRATLSLAGVAICVTRGPCVGLLHPAQCADRSSLAGSHRTCSGQHGRSRCSGSARDP